MPTKGDITLTDRQLLILQLLEKGFDTAGTIANKLPSLSIGVAPWHRRSGRWQSVGVALAKMKTLGLCDFNLSRHSQKEWFLYQKGRDLLAKHAEAKKTEVPAPETPKEAPFDPAVARVVQRLSDDVVVLRLPGLHLKPQMFSGVKMRKNGWCRVTGKFLPKGSQAFAPLTRSIAYCYIDADAVKATSVNEYVGAKKDSK